MKIYSGKEDEKVLEKIKESLVASGTMKPSEDFILFTFEAQTKKAKRHPKASAYFYTTWLSQYFYAISGAVGQLEFLISKTVKEVD